MMSTNERYDETIAGWLEQAAPARLPDRVLEATFERTRKRRQQIGWRAHLGRIHVARSVAALGAVAAVVTVATAMAFGSFVAVGGPSPSDEAQSAFLGTWSSTNDADGRTQRMTVRATQDGTVEIVVTDEVASVCSSGPSTMTGTGRLEGSTRLVIASPVYTCDDGSEAVALSSPPLQEQLRNLTFVRDAQAGNLTDEFGGVWLRTVAAAPSPEPTATASGADVTDLLDGFLEARVAGEGAQQYLNDPEEDIPLLYSTTSGAPYERSEFERVVGIEWPYDLTAFKVRLFAGDTVVEQLFFTGLEDGRLGLGYVPDGFGTDIAPTSEDGQPVAVPYANSFDGQVTLQVAHPWVFRYESPTIRLIPEGPGVRPTTDGGERNDWDELVLMADPVPSGKACRTGPDPADARSLAENIRSDPDLEATVPIAVGADGGADGLMMDVVIPPWESLPRPRYRRKGRGPGRREPPPRSG